MRRLLSRLAPSLILVLATAATAIAQEGRKDGPPRSMARYVPAKDLIFYAEFQGLEAHAPAWKKSATYKLLNDTTLGSLLADLAAQGLAAGGIKPGGKVLSGPDLSGRIDQYSRQPVVLGMIKNKEGKDSPRGVLVFRGGAKTELRGLIEAFAASTATPKDAKTTLRIGGRTIVRYGDAKDGNAVWAEKDDLILCDAEAVKAVIDTLEGKQPSAEFNVTRAALVKPADGFDPVLVAFLDMSNLPPLPPDAVKMGLGGIKRLELRFGFQDDALMSVLRVVAPSPRKGLLALVDQPTFDLASLPPLPSSLTGFTVASLDFGKTYDRIVALMKASDPAGAARIDQAQDDIKKALGIDLRRDLFGHLGPKLSVFSSTPPGAAANPAAGLIGMTLLVQADDGKAVGKVFETLMDILGKELQKEAEKPGRQPGQVGRVNKQPGPRLAWTMTLPPGNTPPGIEPAIVVGKTGVALAASKASADAALDASEKAGSRWTPNGAFAAMGRQVPKKLVFLNVNDPRETLPLIVTSLPTILQLMNMGMAQAAQANPRGGMPARVPIEVNAALVPRADDIARLLFPGSLSIVTEPEGVRIVSREAFPSVTSPAAAGVAVALLLPAVQAAREAARRAQCVNNMKQIGLALHNYHSANDHFPRAAVVDKNGKPLLSWRVAILPYIEEQALYNKFHLDEPWDSEHNKALLQSMPKIYACPSAVRPDPTTTNYRCFVGKNTLLVNDKDTGVRDVTDGTSNTIAVVETKDGVPWTKPEELPIDPAKPPAGGMFGAGSVHLGGFNALMADGSVRFLKLTVKPEVIRALITRNGGEVIQADSY